MSSFNKILSSNQRLATNPLNASVPRTTFNRSFTNKTTFVPGQLIPIFFDEVLPGDHWKIDMKYMLRMATPIVPTMDNAVIDFHFFYVPNRIVWPNWKYFMGENTNAWYSDTTYIVPRVFNTYANVYGNDSSYWRQSNNNTNSGSNNSNPASMRVPKFNSGYKDWDLASYLGVPSGVPFLNDNSKQEGASHISALPFYAYAKIWNDWYKDENLQDDIYIPFLAPTATNEGHQNVGSVPKIVFKSDGTIDTTETGVNPPFNPYNPKNFILSGCGTLPVSKLPDYFTTALPSPQKGNPVELVINSMTMNGQAEVVNRTPLERSVDNYSSASVSGLTTQQVNALNIYGAIDRFTNVSASELTPFGARHAYQIKPSLFNNNSNNFLTNMKNGAYALGVGSVDSSFGTQYVAGKYGIPGSGNLVYSNAGMSKVYSNAASGNWVEDNVFHDMIADLSTATITNIKSGITINDLRLSAALQQYLEINARGGSRYIEILRNHFGVISDDARLQRSEYLGGVRHYNNIMEVLNQAGIPGQSSPLGALGAFSKKGGMLDNVISLAAKEHGFIFGFVIVRVMHTYAQGLEKVWTRKNKFDYYWPVFANIGEQPVYTRELLIHGLNSSDADGWGNNYADYDRVFGYNEAWAEYRYAKNRVSGWFSPNSPNYLSAWSYTDNYARSTSVAGSSEISATAPPLLSSEWIRENKNNIGQTLANLDYDYFILDMYFQVRCTRSMPAFSIPGLTRL